MKWGSFKPLLADAVVAHLEPIQRKYDEVSESDERRECLLEPQEHISVPDERIV